MKARRESGHTNKTTEKQKPQRRVVVALNEDQCAMRWDQWDERVRERGEAETDQEMYCRGHDRLVFLASVFPPDFCPHMLGSDGEIHLQCTLAEQLVKTLTKQSDAGRISEKDALGMFFYLFIYLFNVEYRCVGSG